MSLVVLMGVYREFDRAPVYVRSNTFSDTDGRTTKDSTLTKVNAPLRTERNTAPVERLLFLEMPMTRFPRQLAPACPSFVPMGVQRVLGMHV